MWFTDLTGFKETDRATVHANLALESGRLRSTVNGRSVGIGTLTTPSLAELRSLIPDTGPGKMKEVFGNVADIHAEPASAGAVFQVASQFNLLEMVGPRRTPDEGVDIYEHDRTQGPACAIACGGGTIYRNWYVPVGEQIGQSAELQIDCIADLGQALGNGGGLWTMQNGYCLASSEGLDQIRAKLDAATGDEREHLSGLLRIGLHADVEVTRNAAGHAVTQVYGSALPVAYSEHAASKWEPFARLVLEASYEATLRAAHLNASNSGNHTVFLTRLGGGAFGNKPVWIDDAIDRCLGSLGKGLDVRMVTYR